MRPSYLSLSTLSPEGYPHMSKQFSAVQQYHTTTILYFVLSVVVFFFFFFYHLTCLHAPPKTIHKAVTLTFLMATDNDASHITFSNYL